MSVKITTLIQRVLFIGMKKQAIIATLAIGSVGTLLAQSAPVDASVLGPGRLGFVLEESVITGNNATDFLAAGDAGKNFGLDPSNWGDFSITNLPLAVDPNGGVFSAPDIEDFLGKMGPDRSFLNTDGKIADLVPFPGLGSISDGEVIANTFPLLFFDTDMDGLYGEEDDFVYITETFVRTTSPGSPTGFNVTLNFTGFFRDNLGIIDDTPSTLAIFNGAIDINPNDLAVIDGPNITAIIDNFDDTPITDAPDGLATTGGGDAVFRTEGRDVLDVPEPGTIVGLSIVAGLAGLTAKRRNRPKNS